MKNSFLDSVKRKAISAWPSIALLTVFGAAGLMPDEPTETISDEQRAENYIRAKGCGEKAVEQFRKGETPYCPETNDF